MTGVAKTLDRRLTPARPDIAAKHLKGQVEADAFVAGVVKQVRDGVVDLRREPRRDVGLDTQLHFGETFTVYDEHEGWAWGQSAFDGYVGYVNSDALAHVIETCTHLVSTPRTLVFPAPDFKLSPSDTLHMNAKVALSDQPTKGFVSAAGGFVAAQHIRPVDAPMTDFVAIAEQFVGVPYLWGGRTANGIDCSGLVQTALECTGRNVPRDTDMQETTIGAVRPITGDLSGLVRGDLIFWDRHVGIMLDATIMLHANANHMAVAREPLKDAADRLRALGDPIRSIRRL